jgi:hypothetical protein
MSSPAKTRFPALPLLLILGVVAAFFSVSSQSLWIDEAQTALKAIEPTLRGAFQALDTEHNSNMQMPLHIIYIWFWVQLFGASELALRASNIPCFFLAFFAIAHFLRRHPRLRNVTLLVFCVHPFVLYYLNEARTYALELSGAFLLAGALFYAMDTPEETLPASWWWCYGAGLLILCGATVIGVPWAFGITFILATLPSVRRSFRSALVPALVFVPPLTVLALYLGWTFREDVRNTPLPMTIPSMLSVFYELLGFLGLGPGRIDLRVNSVAATYPYLVPLAFLAFPLAAGLILALRRRFLLPVGRFVAVLLLTGLPVVLTFALGFARHARMLARHFTPLFPFILMGEACAVMLLWDTRRPIARAAACLIVLSLAFSSIELRIAPRHARDDYRSAAAEARTALAQHKIVWWGGEPEGAQYYHLPVTATPEPGTALLVYSLPDHFASPPDEILLSKPDLNDFSGTLTAFIIAHHYVATARWQGFTLWQKPPPGALTPRPLLPALPPRSITSGSFSQYSSFTPRSNPPRKLGASPRFPNV